MAYNYNQSYNVGYNQPPQQPYGATGQGGQPPYYPPASPSYKPYHHHQQPGFPGAPQGPLPGNYSNGGPPNPSGYGPPSHPSPHGTHPPLGAQQSQGYGGPIPSQYGPPPGAPSVSGGGYGPPPPSGSQAWVSGGHSYNYDNSQQKPTYLGCVLLLDPRVPPPPYPPPVSLPTYPQRSVDEDVKGIKSAAKGFGTDENALIRILITTKNANIEVQTLRNAFYQQTGKTLIDELKSELGGWLEMGLTGIVYGPVEFDVYLIEKAASGVGTREELLDEILLGRKPEEMMMLKAEYQRLTRRSLEERVQGELSFKTKQMFNIAMTARWEDLLRPSNQLEALLHDDLLTLNNSLRTGRTDEMAVCNVVLSRSPRHLHELQKRYLAQNKKKLTKTIKSHFSGHMEQALVYVLSGAKRDFTGAHRDAKWIEKSMKGMGTKDNELVYRILRASWDPKHFQEVSHAYKTKYRKNLKDRIKGETSGKYENMLVAICDNCARLGSVAAYH